MDAEYLKDTVGDVLAQGLAATIIRNPPDSVQYLAQWLLSYVDNQNADEQKQEQREVEEQLLAKAEQEENERELEKQNKTEVKKQREDEKDEAIVKLLQESTDFDAMLEQFVELLRDRVGASSAYVGEVDNGETLNYIAATPNSAHLLEQKLQRNQGVTWEIFEDQPENNEQEEEEDATEENEENEDGTPVAPKEKKEKKEPTLPSVYVPNVLMGPKSDQVHFFKSPGVGCYYAVRIRFQSCLNDGTLEETLERESSIIEQKREEDAQHLAEKQAASEEDGEEEEEAEVDENETEEEAENRRSRRKKAQVEEVEPEPETEEQVAARLAAERAAEEEYLISKLSKKQRDLALSLDSLGQANRFNAQQLSLINKYAILLQQNMDRLDKALFKIEKEKRKSLVDLTRTHEEKDEEERATELEQLSEELLSEGKPNTTADAQYRYRYNLLVSLKPTILDFASHHVFRGPLVVLQALFYLLEYPKEDICNAEEQPDWKKMKTKISDELYTKFQEYDPRAPTIKTKKGSKYNSPENIINLLASVEYEEVRERNYPLAEIYNFIKDALSLKQQAQEERAEAKRQAEREKQEREAAERAAAEAAEEGAEGEQEGEEGEAEAEENADE